MTYRDEFDAAQQRIAALEAELAKRTAERDAARRDGDWGYTATLERPGWATRLWRWMTFRRWRLRRREPSLIDMRGRPPTPEDIERVAELLRDVRRDQRKRREPSLIDMRGRPLTPEDIERGAELLRNEPMVPAIPYVTVEDICAHINAQDDNVCAEISENGAVTVSIRTPYGGGGTDETG